MSNPLGGSHASARFPQPKRTFRGLGFLVVLGHGVFPGGAYVMGGRVGVRSTYVRVELDPTLPYPIYTTYIYIYTVSYPTLRHGPFQQGKLMLFEHFPSKMPAPLHKY